MKGSKRNVNWRGRWRFGHMLEEAREGKKRSMERKKATPGEWRTSKVKERGRKRELQL